jgi:predicted Ser/Thr protein kinase
MYAVRESPPAFSSELQVCFGYQGRWLQRVLAPFSAQVPRRDPKQLVVQDRDKIIQDGFVSAAKLLEQIRNARAHVQQRTASVQPLHYNDADFERGMRAEVRGLFHELADLTRAERQRVLRERGIAPELMAEVESLLSFDSANSRCLTACVSEAAEELLHAGEAEDPVSCGPYRLVRLLGSGGMGNVYLGERTDGEIRQRVAIKLLRAGSHEPGRRERFLNERQILASLNYASIVRVLDAGHTPDGRPYLVMEYVEGTPIDVYAAQLDVRDRLSLFLHVCEGVSHAHRSLIIHRDLKPSNILVDASGQVKVLDFGIAKLLDETGDPAQTVERLLTPQYASPEQLSGTPQSTATDVYSLGAVLHKLLTGRVPCEGGSPEALPKNCAAF